MLVEQIRRWGESSFGPPASPIALESCESRLGHALPDQLRHLLAEANGVEGEYGLGLVWTAERIANDNTHFRGDDRLRRTYMPFDGLVFFADAGNGDQFAISLAGSHAVFAWSHEDDRRKWIAPSVIRYLEDWMTGAVTI